MDQYKDIDEWSEEELENYIESGNEINGWYVDEALIYDNKIS